MEFAAIIEEFSSIWMQLKNYLLERDPEVTLKTLYICSYCQPILNEDKVPGRCVINNLYTEPVPEELCSLNGLEKQFIQCAKCFHSNSGTDGYLYWESSYLQLCKGCQRNNVIFYHCHCKTHLIG